MNIADLIGLGRAVPTILGASGDRALANTLIRDHGPTVARALWGPGADDIYKAGIAFADKRGWTADVIDAEYEVVDDEEHCTLCAPWYDPAGEKRFVKDVLGLDGGLVFILGLRKTGKTALAVRLAELWDRKTFTLGLPQRVLPPGWTELVPPPPGKPKARPTRAKGVPGRSREDALQALEDILGRPVDPKSLDGLPPPDPNEREKDWIEAALPMGATLIVDDAGLVLDSMDSGGSVKAMKHLIQIVRHRALNLAVNVQYSSAVTKYVLDADAIMLKPPPMMWRAIERDDMIPFIEEAEPFWTQLSPRAQKNHTWVISSVYKGPVHYRLPSMWSRSLSFNKAD